MFDVNVSQDAENKQERTNAAETASPSLGKFVRRRIMARIATSNNEYKLATRAHGRKLSQYASAFPFCELVMSEEQ